MLGAHLPSSQKISAWKFSHPPPSPPLPYFLPSSSTTPTMAKAVEKKSDKKVAKAAKKAAPAPAKAAAKVPVSSKEILEKAKAVRAVVVFLRNIR